LSRGSSFSRDSLRDDVIPERDEDSELRPMSWSEEASEASSRESRGGFWIAEKPRRDISVNSFREANVDVAISSWSRLSCAEHLIARRSKPIFQVSASQTNNLKIARSSLASLELGLAWKLALANFRGFEAEVRLARSGQVEVKSYQWRAGIALAVQTNRSSRFCYFGELNVTKGPSNTSMESN
jgi:hypothetical protein